METAPAPAETPAIAPLQSWLPSPLPQNVSTEPLPFAFVCGPCSAESAEQVLQSAHIARRLGAQIMRAGVWKPRTRPGTFEGRGAPALPWLQAAQAETGMPFMVEVATPDHLEAALKAGAAAVWLGARTTVSPFAVQSLADALRGTDLPVLVKNPINPDLELWQGAIERVQQAGVSRLATVHRGFSSYEKHDYRNPPYWQLAVELRRRMPELPFFIDPSHIAGRAHLVPEVAQHALDLAYQGIMVEVHPNPSVALSDAAQQLDEAGAERMLSALRTPATEGAVPAPASLLALRDRVDAVDEELLTVLRRRMNLIAELGTLKDAHKMAVLQPQRWADIVRSRTARAKGMGLPEAFVQRIMQLIHQESLAVQTRQRAAGMPPSRS